MMDDATLHDAKLQELAHGLGARAAEGLDVERTAKAVVERLRTEPRAEVWVWMRPAWLRIAAAVVVLVGTGALALEMGTNSRTPPTMAAVAELGELSADELREVLDTVGQPEGEQPTVSAQEVGLEQLSAPQLRALLESLEG